jgi:glycosyltransferase involved in cell wall biosynthesis
MQKLLIICPHLSTGGSGQVTYNKIELIKDHFQIKVVEWAFLAWKFVVQRNRIINAVGNENFYSLGEHKDVELSVIIDDFKPDIISMEEFPEMFIHDENLLNEIYSNERDYTILETTHDSSFNPKHKRWMPDKFVFVSPYNALKYNHLNIPYEIIEYPVDIKEQKKKEAIEKLGLNNNFKHVIIVGLFTPRKNQKYAFDIAHQCADYKIQFHFIGNQADNFSSYWKPIMQEKEMNPKLSNCIIWNERSDSEDFYNAADLFLFPSKGDRGNKELMPLVIKEALEFPALPKLMYNLDVYLNRFNDTENMHFLKGDVYNDAKKVLELTKPKDIENKDEIIILGTYPNLKSRVQLTKDTINSLKSLDRKIMLLSHYPVDEETQRMVDYYIYDSHNPLTHHSYYTRFYRDTSEYYAEVNINGLKFSNQSLTVLVNLFNGAKAAKQLGFSKFFYTTYDVVLMPQDQHIVDMGFISISNNPNIIGSSLKAYLGSLNTPFGKGIQTNGMFFDVDFFLETFDDVREAWRYNEICKSIGAQNFLEDYMIKKLQPSIDDNIVGLQHNKEETLLQNSGLGVASNSEYYSILPIENHPNNYMFYFYTYNVDDRKVNIIIKEEGNEFYNNRFQISKLPEFKKEFQYVGKPIEITLDFYDGEDIYKTESYTLNSNNIVTYNNTGIFKKKNIKPKIKLVHIQTTLNDEREQKSRQSLQSITEYGIEYIIHTNVPYPDLPPKHNCLRPECVSMDLFDEPTVTKLGTALTPAHYGCFEAFKNAILSEFYDCDFLIVCEGDCIIEKPMDEFVNAIYEAAKLCDQNNIGFFSFGDTKTLEHGWIQSKMVQEIHNQDLIFITNHIIGIQSIMFPKFTSNWLKEQLRTHVWDAADIYFNTIFKKSDYKMGIVKKRFTTQANGYSLIDKQNKKFL